MIQFFATLHVLGVQAMGYVDDQFDTLARARDERGSITIEQVLWAVAVIGIAGAVILIIKNFVERKAGEIK